MLLLRQQMAILLTCIVDSQDCSKLRLFKSYIKIASSIFREDVESSNLLDVCRFVVLDTPPLASHH